MKKHNKKRLKAIWGKINLGILLLAWLLSLPAIALAQDTLRLTLSHQNDSTFCPSILGHQPFFIEYYIPAHLEDKVTYDPRHFEIQFRINSGPWKPSRRKAGFSFDTPIYGAPGKLYGAYMDYFSEEDSLYYTPLNNKVLIEARLWAALGCNHIYANHYSNIDSVYLDIPTPEDRAAFQYLASQRDTIDLNDFIWMIPVVFELGSQYYTLRDSFPGTVLSDMARFQIWRFRYHNEFMNKEQLTPADRAYLLDTYQALLNARSMLIRETAKHFYYQGSFGMDKKLE